MSENPRARLLLLIPHLGGGGAERVMELLAQGLNSQKYELHLGLVTGLVTQLEIDAKEDLSFVRVHCLGAARVRGGALRLLKLVRRLQPDLILSGMFHLNFLVLLLRPLFPRKTRVLVRQNVAGDVVRDAPRRSIRRPRLSRQRPLVLPSQHGGFGRAYDAPRQEFIRSDFTLHIPVRVNSAGLGGLLQVEPCGHCGQQRRQAPVAAREKRLQIGLAQLLRIGSPSRAG